jgi:hypothetical protein
MAPEMLTTKEVVLEAAMALQDKMHSSWQCSLLMHIHYRVACCVIGVYKHTVPNLLTSLLRYHFVST